MFATILELFSFRKINYYTILIELEDGEDFDMFEDFTERHEEKYPEDLAILKIWLKRLGNKHGAREDMFRPEAYRGGDAKALPPIAKYLDTEKTDLRLYCMIIDENNVILFNGDMKTANSAQDCDNVRPHFLLANKISKAILEAIMEREITVNPNTRKLEMDDGFELFF